MLPDSAAKCLTAGWSIMVDDDEQMAMCLCRRVDVFVFLFCCCCLGGSFSLLFNNEITFWSGSFN